MQKTAKIINFKDLKIWHTGKLIVVAVYSITRTLPRSETFGLISQMRRAAVAIPSNISEGFNRYHNRDYKRFLYITLGSCAELETQIILSAELGYVEEDVLQKICKLLDHECRMIRALIKKL